MKRKYDYLSEVIFSKNLFVTHMYIKKLCISNIKLEEETHSTSNVIPRNIEILYKYWYRVFPLNLFREYKLKKRILIHKTILLRF